MSNFEERHAGKIAGAHCCYNRVVTGTVPEICFAKGMTNYLCARSIRIFDYTKWAEPYRNAIRQDAERLAAEAGLEIEFVRKEERVRKNLRARGASRPGPRLLGHGDLLYLN